MEEKNNSLAVGSLAISIIGLFINLIGIVPIIGILFAISAIMHINDKGGKGKEFAIAGLIIGIVGLVWSILQFVVCGITMSMM